MSDSNRPFPTRSSSLSRGARPQRQQEEEEEALYPPLRDPYLSDPSDSDPLTSDNSPRVAQTQAPQTPRGVLPYRSPPSSTSVTQGAFGDQPYYGREGRGGSLDLSDAYDGTAGPPPISPSTTLNDSRARGRNDSLETTHSRVPLYTPPANTMPIYEGASVQMAPLPPGVGTRGRAPEQRYGAGEKAFKSEGYKSARSHSRDSSRDRAGLGNWAGPARGASPYGPIGNAPSPLAGAAPNSHAPTPSSSNPNLLFAEGDFVPPPRNAFARFVFRIFDSSFVVRWVIYILPLLGLLWIPGILGLTAYPNTRVWGCPLQWWSAWLTVVWCGWWGAALVARCTPIVLRNTLGAVAPELRHYIMYVEALQFYSGAAAWALANWITFAPLVKSRSNGDSGSTLSLIIQGLFGIFLSLVILLVEKLMIQVIAHNFHKKSYEDRIIEQKFQIRCLTALYLNSHDSGRRDTLDGARLKAKRQASDPSLLIKKALHATKRAAQTATTIIGLVGTEMTGERVLQPNSPASMVTNALGSTNKTKQLARRIYFSFVPSYRTALLLEDISRCFQNREQAERAFAVFDKDGNGDISLDELEMACLEIHRERLALSNSMRDIDSAVGRLDSIIMSIWWVAAALIMAGLLDTSFQTMIAGAGTLILGLSWLIGTTAQEILASIIFLFVKHVYDVGDRVDIDSVSYVVKEMHLLSTIFRRTDGVIVQAPHNVLNTKFINNIRRSGPIMEAFTWDVAFDTTFEKIEALRTRMLEFLEIERRDFIPQIDIAVQDFVDQGKLTLTANIMYKSNSQNGALKAQRRNKWCCALKLAMESLSIFGPAGAGNPAPDPAEPVEYTQVPYEVVEKKKAAAAAAAEAAEKKKGPHVKGVSEAEVLRSGGDVVLSDPRAVLQDDGNPVLDESRAGSPTGSDSESGEEMGLTRRKGAGVRR